MKRSLAVQFYLRRTRLPGNPSDFEVFDSSRRVVGRIMRHPQASEVILDDNRTRNPTVNVQSRVLSETRTSDGGSQS